MSNRALLIALAHAPESQIASSVTAQFKAIAERKEEPTPDQMVDLLDECAFSSLASDFAMRAMDIYWRELGGNEEQARRRRRERGPIQP